MSKEPFELDEELDAALRGLGLPEAAAPLATGAEILARATALSPVAAGLAGWKLAAVLAVAVGLGAGGGVLGAALWMVGGSSPDAPDHADMIEEEPGSGGFTEPGAREDGASLRAGEATTGDVADEAPADDQEQQVGAPAVADLTDEIAPSPTRDPRDPGRRGGASMPTDKRLAAWTIEERAGQEPPHPQPGSAESDPSPAEKVSAATAPEVATPPAHPEGGDVDAGASPGLSPDPTPAGGAEAAPGLLLSSRDASPEEERSLGDLDENALPAPLPEEDLALADLDIEEIDPDELRVPEDALGGDTTTTHRLAHAARTHLDIDVGGTGVIAPNAPEQGPRAGMVGAFTLSRRLRAPTGPSPVVAGVAHLSVLAGAGKARLAPGLSGRAGWSWETGSTRFDLGWSLTGRYLSKDLGPPQSAAQSEMPAQDRPAGPAGETGLNLSTGPWLGGSFGLASGLRLHTGASAELSLGPGGRPTPWVGLLIGVDLPVGGKG